ncbi:hypothetical protein FNJ84_15885 [Paracoccus sp. M683]|uniref:hypothetical protein n=1 Tax=Paracoccus sp. M683 TaxID=2594268 RepID=UPI00117ED374|nr:hypothetical protein [Paracoccus sp. M683]TRW95468.1 hypothetical protein FNJ84_15885 [Paracoccus sp. M683]
MKPLAALIVTLGLSACALTEPGGLASLPPLSDPESRLVARGPGGAWADAAPLAGLESAGAECATTSKGAACLLKGDAATPDRSLATAREGRCLARSGPGQGTTVTVVTLHRNASSSPRRPRFERLYYPVNSGAWPDVTSRLSDPAAFTRLCDQLLQPDTLATRIDD